MIVDSIANKDLYASHHPNVRKALEFLASKSAQELELGRHEIDGDAVYALVQTYETTPESEKKFEAHREYIDVQYVKTGNEILYYMNTDRMVVSDEYDPEKDCLFLSDIDSVPVLLSDGDFVILHPHDAHKPGCDAGASSTVSKIVVKCKIR